MTTRPSCPHCNRGPLVADRDLNGRVRSILCLNCGNRIWRDHIRRIPTATERNIGPGHGRAGTRGIPVHTHATCALFGRPDQPRQTKEEGQ